MADVPGKFYRATKVRTGVSPSSAGSIEGEPLPPVNPPGSSLNSVGLTMPSAFTVSNSPLTANGTIGVAGAGTVAQYIRGDGSLADFPETSGGGASVSYYLNGSVAQGTIGGVAYKEMNKVPIFGAGTDFTINANGYIASFITDAGDPNLLEIPGGNWNFETYFSSSSNGGTPTFYVELYKVNSGGTATLIASNSANPEFIAFGTITTAYFTTLAVPTTTLALTDRLAVRYYVTHSGRTITMHTEGPHLCQIITTFTTGLTALNGLTAQVQNFAVGTTGTDFNIASATATHTFNLPTASATNRGALSTSDWSMFNAKENAITAGTTAQYFRGDKTFQTLNTAAVPELTNLYYTDARSRAALSFAAGSGAYNTSTGVITIPTNNNQIANGAGYITSAALAGYLPLTGGTLTGPLGGTSISLSGDITANRYRGVNSLVLNSYTTVNPSSNVYLYSPPNDRDAWIYLDSADTGSNWGIYHRQIDTAVSGLPTNSIGFVGGGSSTLQAWISLGNGNGFFAGSLTASNLSGTNTGDVTIGTGNGLSLIGQQISLGLASGSSNGALSSTDWTTFNSKQNAGNYVTTDTTQTITASKTFSLDIIVNGVNVGRGGGSIFTNTRIGNLAFVNNTTGANNTSVGYGSLGSNTTGNSNSAFGKDSLGLNTSGTNNSALGLNALVSNTTGGNNIGIGLSSLGNNTTGSENIGIGSYAGSITNGAIANNTSSNSIYIGYYTRASADGNTNEIVIGYDARGQGSNSAIIGNSSITKTILNGNVGIGTPSPSEKLEVQDGYLSTYHNANSNDAGYGVQFYTNGGGSKNSLASILLSQVGTARSGNLIFNTSNSGAPTTKMTITSGGNVLIASNSDNGQAIVQIGGSNNTKLSLKDGTSQNGMRWESVGGANTFYLFNGNFGTTGWGLYNVTTAGTPFWVTNGGNVGIGTTNPTTFASYITTQISGPAGGGLIVESTTGTILGQFFADNGFSGGAAISFGSRTNNPVVFLTNNAEKMRITSGGNVLIGTTTSTGAKLEINGDIRTGALDGGYVSGYWKMGRAILGTQPTETYQIIVEINGALYAIGAANL